MRALAAALLAGIATGGAFASPPTYEVTRLDPPKGPLKVGWSATGLNASGMVAGHGFGQGFRWTREQGFTRLHTRPDLYPIVRGIDDAGVAVGLARFVFSLPSATIFPLSGPARNLGSLLPEASHSEATSISSAGHVAGWYLGIVDGRQIAASFVWDSSDGMQRIGDTETGAYTYAHGVNRAGQVVGNHQSGSNSGFVWTRETGTIDIPGTNVANAINDRGDIVGQASGEPYAAFLLDRDSTMIRLPAPEGLGGNCEALDINEAGQIVGYCSHTQYGVPAHAILWWPDEKTFKPVDLNEAFGIDDGHVYQTCAARDDNGRGFVDYRAVATNDTGQILVQVDCNYTFDTSRQVMGLGSVLLTPVANDASPTSASTRHPWVSPGDL